MPEKSDLTTRLFTACRDGDIKEVNTLIKHNVSLDGHYLEANLSIMQVSLLTYHQSSTLLQHNKSTIFRLLLAQAPKQLFYQNLDGDTVAHFLATNGCNDLISELLPTEPSLFMIPNAQMKYPIFSAVLNHQYETVKLLLSANREFCNLEDARKQNILHYAVQSMDSTMLEICLSFCSKLTNNPNFDGETPLTLAKKMRAPNNMIVMLESAIGYEHCSSSKMR